MYKAFVLTEHAGKVSAEVQSLDESQLPPGKVTVAVEYSSLNYKDGMVIKGIGRMVRKYPHVPGIDLAGRVESSDDPGFKPGDAVVLTGWRVGESHWGGYAQKARVDSAWLLPLPAGLSTKRAMALGTAGLTAALAVMALEEHGLSPGGLPVLVTGASGGVGSVAVMLLAAGGYAVTAVTGRKENYDYLRQLGASQILDRGELAEPCDKPLEHENWAAVIDNVGGAPLARALAQTQTHGSVAAIGLAAGRELHTTVLPFLLRGVNLLGIESNTCPVPRRLAAWQRLTKEIKAVQLDAITHLHGLSGLPALADQILQGQTRGRVVIDVNKV